MLRKLATVSLCLAGLFGSAALGLAEEKTAASEEGFKPLFDGKTLDGLEGDTEGYEVRDGAIVCVPSKGGFLYTDKDYASFVLRFEFKLPEGANNGIGVHVPVPTGDPAYSGIEFQVLDDDYKGIAPYQAHGSAYGIAAAKRGHQKPNGEWNEQEIRLDGKDVKVTLNGVVILETNLDEATKDGTLDKREHPGLKRETGRICFCGHGAEVAFRNVRIQELDGEKN